MSVHNRDSPERFEPASVVMAYALSARDLADQLNVQPTTSLAAGAALQRKNQFGPNQLPSPPQRQAWQVFAAQFKSILILILAGASGLSALIGNVNDALVILAVMLINATVGFYQEWRAEESAGRTEGDVATASTSSA